MKVLRALLIVGLLFLTSCASMLNIGREDFVCKGDGEGGRCGDAATIYANRDRILEEAKIKEVQKQQGEVKEEQKGSVSYLDIRHSEEELDDAPVPVRSAEQIQRIRIYSFQDETGAMFGDIWSFIVAKPGQWYLPDGRVLE